MKAIFISTALVAFAPMAAASDAEIEVTPGLWAYDVTALLGGLPMGDTGRECVTPAKAKRSLSRTAEALGQGCRITRTEAIEDGYRFAMACDGGVRGEVDGQIVTTAHAAVLTAEGWIGEGAQRAPVTITGSAEKIAETCTAS